MLVEDDQLLGQGLRAGLQAQGFTVDWYQDGSSADTALRTVDYGCVVLDLGLPGRDGMSWLASWRRQDINVHVLILTARDAESSLIDGLDAGGDDYLIKPVSARELAARIRAITRRTRGSAHTIWEHGALRYDSAAKLAHWQGRPVELTSRELALLEVFLRFPNRVLSKQQIFEHLYGWDQDPASNALEVFVHNLRRKLDSSIVRTVRGVGYALGPATPPGPAAP
ncbi:MAG: response regulator transcription factor [Burkholderiaceae bacterium]